MPTFEQFVNEMMSSNDNKLPAGKYFVGDPCYTISNERWDSYLKAYYKATSDKVETACFEFDGMMCCVAPTMHGDGTYDSSHGPISVDAGLIGATPIELSDYSEEQLSKLGAIIVFDEPFGIDTEMHVEGPGEIRIGEIFSVNTDYEDYYDEDDEFYYGSDDDEEY